MPRPAETEFDATVNQAFGAKPGSDPCLAQKVDGTLLKDAGTDTPEHVLGAFVLDDQRIDAGEMEQLSQQKTRRPGTYDCNLNTHLPRSNIVLITGRFDLPTRERR
jgi:hypothetical protein